MALHNTICQNNQNDIFHLFMCNLIILVLGQMYLSQFMEWHQNMFTNYVELGKLFKVIENYLWPLIFFF